MDKVKYIKDSIEIKQKILSDKDFLLQIDNVAEKIIKCYETDNKVLIAGNGGSANDAQHIAGEFIAKMFVVRKALSAIALSANSAVVTAIANDTEYKNIFSRQIEALGRKEDIFIALSTSGNSENIVKALEVAKQKGCITVGFTGENTCKIEGLCDYIFKIPTQCVSQIQETYMMICHIICAIVEKHFS